MTALAHCPDWGRTEGRRWSEPAADLIDHESARERTLTALAEGELDGLDLFEHGAERAALARLLKVMAKAKLQGHPSWHETTEVVGEAHRMLDAILAERSPAWWEDCDAQERRVRMARVRVASC